MLLKILPSNSFDESFDKNRIFTCMTSHKENFVEALTDKVRIIHVQYLTLTCPINVLGGRVSMDNFEA